MTSSGAYNDILQSADGCDSIVTLNLTINNSTSSDTTATACDSFVWRGVTYTGSGTYSETLQTISGCDSVVTLNLTINNSTTGDTTATACDSFDWYGNTYTSTGTYSETLQTINGCDSVVTLNLTINTSPSFSFSDDTISQCNVDSVLLDAGAGYASYNWSNGANTPQTYAASNGFYTATVTDANGCSSNDSVCGYVEC